MKQTFHSKLAEQANDPEKLYNFLERSGMCIDSGMSCEEADRKAYRQIFQTEPKETN